jgi:hypothetical protein
MVIADEVPFKPRRWQAMRCIERLPHEPICVRYVVSDHKRHSKDHEE